jgi:hypothetical protein
VLAILSVGLALAPLVTNVVAPRVAQAAPQTVTNTIFSDYAVGLRTGPATATNAFTGTAGFVVPAAGDYHLRGTSAAIDRGVSTSLTVDIDGQSRPQGSAPGAQYGNSVSGICGAQP